MRMRKEEMYIDLLTMPSKELLLCLAMMMEKNPQLMAEAIEGVGLELREPLARWVSSVYASILEFEDMADEKGR